MDMRVSSISFRIGSTSWISNFHRNCSTVDRFSSISVLEERMATLAGPPSP